ncbi:MAG TPA: hypothetical protein VF829_02800 [Candidatus Paceibacterota bacterium]
MNETPTPIPPAFTPEVPPAPPTPPVAPAEAAVPLPETLKLRTYARDLARMKGEPVPEEPPTPVPPPPPPPSPKPHIPEPALVTTPVSEQLTPEPSAQDKLVAGSTLPQKPEVLDFASQAPVPPTPTHTPPPQDISAPVHTYRSDFIDRVRETGATQTDVLAAEQDARGSRLSATQEKSPVSRGRSVALAFGSFFLVAASGLGVWYAYGYNLRANTPVSTGVAAPSLIAADNAQEVSGTGSALMQAIAAASAKPIADGSVTILYTATTTYDTAGIPIHTPESGGQLIAALGLPMPGLLARTIALDSTVGITHAGEGTHPFFILHVASYDAAFAGMLAWEKTLAHDLAPVYPTPVASASTASSTATSTQTAARSAPAFIDEVIANHDARVLRDNTGNTILLYGFWNKNILVIARDPAAFASILSRLGNSSTQH